MNKAITSKDTTELKNLTTAFSQLAKTAQLDNLIDETHTDDLTTLAEVVQIVEDSGFEMPYYDNKDRDGIDFAIHDIENSTAKLVRDATGLGPQIEQMMNKYKEDAELKKTEAETKKVTLEDMFNAYDEDNTPVEEDDSEITQATFTDDDTGEGTKK